MFLSSLVNIANNYMVQHLTVLVLNPFMAGVLSSRFRHERLNVIPERLKI